MTRWETIKSLLTLNPPSLKAAPVSTEYFGPVGQRAADWSGVATSAKVRDAWMKCATAFACITLLADAVAESPLKAYRTNPDGDLEELPKHGASYLLENPNPLMSGAEFRSLLVMTMGLHGYGCIEKVRSGARLPVELWPLRPDWLKREYVGSGTNATQWVYRVPGRDPRPIADEDLLIVPYYHDPAQVSLGLSPLHIVAREVGIDVALTDLLKVFIDAGGIPPWAIKLTGDFDISQAEKDAFRESWRNRYGGSRAYHEVGILNPGMDLVKVGDSIGDMAWPDLRGLTEMKIAQAFRVPADLIQARDSMSSGSLTTTEMDGAMAFLQNHGAQPLRTRIDGAFSRGLLPDFGAESGVVLEFDTSMIMSLQEDRNALSARVINEFNGRLITLNEARLALGYPDLGTDGDVFPVLFNVTYLRPEELAGTNAQGPLFAPVARAGETQPEAEAAATNAGPDDLAYRLALSRPRELPAGKAQRVYRDLKALSADELEVRASNLATTRREREKLVQIGERQLRKFFAAQGARVVAGLKSGPDIDAKADGIDWDAEARRLWDEVFDQFFGRVGETAFGNVSATVGATIAWDLANPNIGKVMDELGKRIVDISDQTRQDVVKVITDGQADGLSLQQISDNLTGMFEETYRSRSMTIARTETMLSYSKASVLGYQESGVVDQVELSDNVDHDEDYGASDGLTCATRDGLVVDLADVDKHIEAEHPNGSLAVIPLLSKPLGGV